MKMPFGRYKGEHVADLPDHYLDWIYHLDDLRGRLRQAVRTEWRARFESESEDPVAGAAGTLDHEDLALLSELVRAG